MYLDPSQSSSYSGTGNTLYDLTANGNNATLYNSPVFSTEKGGTLVFNGTDNRATIPMSSSLAVSANTVEMWIKVTYIGSSVIFEAGAAKMLLKPLSSDTNLQYGDTPFGFNSDAFAGLFNNQWNHVLYSSSSNNELYLNGVLIDSRFFGFTNQRDNIINIMGRNGSLYQSGSIGLIRVYDRALNSSEVSQNYNAGITRFS